MMLGFKHGLQFIDGLVLGQRDEEEGKEDSQEGDQSIAEEDSACAKETQQ